MSEPIVRLQPVYGPSHPGHPTWKVAVDIEGDTLLSTITYVLLADAQRVADRLETLFRSTGETS